MYFRYQMVFDPTFGGGLKKFCECTPDPEVESCFAEPKLHSIFETTTDIAFQTDFAQNCISFGAESLGKM